MTNWQDTLWAFVNALDGWPDKVLGIIALLTALVSFVYLILHHGWSALVAARSMVALGMAMYFYSGFNSGWLKPGLWLMVMGIAFSNFLIVTRWCDRLPGQPDPLTRRIRQLRNYFWRTFSNHAQPARMREAKRGR